MLCKTLLAISAVVGPLSCVQVPEPLEGTLPLRCTVSFKHVTLSAPAFDGVTAWYTVITAVSLYNAEHMPFCTSERYHVVAFRLLYAWLAVVLTKLVQVLPLSVLRSHLVILPVVPLNVRVPEFDVAHTVAFALI